MAKLRWRRGESQVVKTKDGKEIESFKAVAMDEPPCKECKKRPRDQGARCRECREAYRTQQLNDKKLQRKIEATLKQK